MHARVPLSPAAGTIEAIQLLAQQLEEDRKHMEILKAAIERTHEKVETQERVLEHHGQQLGEQNAMNVKIFKDLADIKGDLTQHKVHSETWHADIQAAVSGAGLADLITACIDSKIGSISEDMNKVKYIVEEHERRELEMGTYLEGLAGDRPAEGKFIIGKFEHIDKKLIEISESVLSLQVADTVNATAEQAEIDAISAKVLFLSGAHDRFSGNLSSFQEMQGRVAAVEAAVAAAATGGLQS
jgi:hypothetical protein